MLAIAREQIHTGDVIAGNQPLNFIKNRGRIERAQLRLEAVRLKPNRMAVGLARLRPARLSHISMRTAAERDEFANVKTHGIRDADDHLEVSLCARDLACLF